MAESSIPTLEMRQISKTFPGVKALNGVQLKAWGGEVHALMGENGAGKSTLDEDPLRRLPRRRGRRDPDRRPADPDHRPDRRQAGRHRHHLPGAEPRPEPDRGRKHLSRRRAAQAAAWSTARRCADGCRPVLERLGAPFTPETTVGTLSIAEQQLVEIARALHAKSKILVLDEPTTALSSRETERLFALIRQLRAEGIALIYISHRMAEVYELSDRVSVLRDGTYVGTLTATSSPRDALVKMMVGRDLSSFYTKEHDPHGSRGPVILEVKGDHRRRPAGEACELPAAPGRGAGHRRPGRLGPHRACAPDLRRRPKAGGEVLLDGQPVRHQPPEDALDRGPRLPDRGPQAARPVPGHVRAARTSTSA